MGVIIGRFQKVSILLSLAVFFIFVMRLQRCYSEPKNVFIVDNNYIYLNGNRFIVKGIHYLPEYPGELPWELRELKPLPKNIRNRILTDIRDIKGLNVNTVRFWEHPGVCYEGAKKENLYIFQTIWVDGAIKDYQDISFKNSQKKYIRYTIDRVHNLNGVDYSDLILAYAIGNELSKESIITTNLNHFEVNKYEGKYISAPSGSSATECFVAEMADYVKKYEYDTYGVIHLVTYSNMQFTESLLDCSFLDFICFNAYCHDTRLFSVNELGSYTGTYYQGWLEKMKRKFSNKPLLISEFGLSTAPGQPCQGGYPDYSYGGNSD